MRIKKLLISIILFVLTLSLWSFDLSLANHYQYSPDGNEITERDITKDLFTGLREADAEGVLFLSLIKSKNFPKSILDAAAISESEGIDFLLYGFLKVEKNYYDLEVKLYDRDAARIKTVFYAKNSIDNYENLVQTISKRIIAYFYKTLGVTRQLDEKEIEYGVIDIKSGIGYWFPFNPWSESLIGMFSLHIDTSLTPVSSLFKWDIYTFALGYGLGFDYSLGMNKEGYESYYFHSMKFGFPVSLSALWHKRNKLFFQIAPEIQLDILVQDRLYGSLTDEKSAIFSLSTSIGYEYIFTDKRLSLGVETRLHTAFYKQTFFSAEPSFYLRYRCKPLNKAWSEASLHGSKSLPARPCNHGKMI